MKGIMFNDRFGLTEAVLEGRKTMTRRIVPIGLYNQTDWKAVTDGDYKAVVDGEEYYHDIRDCGQYRVGEVVAIAQSYKNICDEYLHKLFVQIPWAIEKLFSSPGWKNKMFTRPSLMPHHIRITDLKVERLQDISNVDCLREGIYPIKSEDVPQINEKGVIYYTYSGIVGIWETPRQAFASLIDKVGKKGTWSSNPVVFVYSFVRID